MSDSREFIRWFDQTTLQDIPLVGGKNASLGEMYRALASHGIRVPNGFAVTAAAYRYFLTQTGISSQIAEILSELTGAETNEIQEAGKKIRSLISESEFPAALKTAIQEAYGKLEGGGADVAVRSSATAEDLPSASFAGQQETYLNVSGQTALIEACRRCFASLFTDRAITYRQKIGFRGELALSIGVQKMVRSDLACSGVLFTLDTESGFRDVVLVEGSYGLGENVVQGVVNPDEFIVFKPKLREGFAPILEKKLGRKEVKLIYDTGGGQRVRNVQVPAHDRRQFCLTDEEILRLARWACVIEEHYSNLLKHPAPMDIEWAKDGRTGEIFIVQARPETVQSQKAQSRFEAYHLLEKGKLLVEGQSVGDRIGSGRVRVIKNLGELEHLKPAEVLVTEHTNPDWEPYMRRVAALVTDEGGRTCHAAIVSRELGIPAVVGATNATQTLTSGQLVTVSAAEGERGKVYEGALKYEVQTISPTETPPLKTRIMLNVADPDQAFPLSFIPNDGVGLARMEFIINHHIKIHPLALLQPEKIDDLKTKNDMEELLGDACDPAGYFVDKLASGIAKIGAAFYPKDVIVRFSDFKTNEYAALIGGKYFEPHEDNPMLGFRGASRYYDPLYRDAFALECKAVRKARETMGLTNIKTMVPFCRTVEEGRRVLEEMKKNGLERGKNGLEVYMMCEIPSNVILAKQFALLFDGFSIGSNDLTQLVLGVDRDSGLIAHLFDERNAAVKAVIAQVIGVAKEAGKKIGICGQGPSDFPDFAEFLIRCGIDSLSLNPDSVIKTRRAVAKVEAECARRAEDKPQGNRG